MEAFVGFIERIISFIQNLVAYFRAKNDGDENAEMPKF